DLRQRSRGHRDNISINVDVSIDPIHRGISPTMFRRSVSLALAALGAACPGKEERSSAREAPRVQDTTFAGTTAPVQRLRSTRAGAARLVRGLPSGAGAALPRRAARRPSRAPPGLPTIAVRLGVPGGRRRVPRAGGAARGARLGGDALADGTGDGGIPRARSRV